MKPNWRATFVCGVNRINLDFYLKPRKGQEGKRKESLKAFDFSDTLNITLGLPQGVFQGKLEEVTYLGD